MVIRHTRAAGLHRIPGLLRELAEQRILGWVVDNFIPKLRPYKVFVDRDILQLVIQGLKERRWTAVRIVEIGKERDGSAGEGESLALATPFG